MDDRDRVRASLVSSRASAPRTAHLREHPREHLPISAAAFSAGNCRAIGNVTPYEVGRGRGTGASAGISAVGVDGGSGLVVEKMLGRFSRTTETQHLDCKQ